MSNNCKNDQWKVEDFDSGECEINHSKSDDTTHDAVMTFSITDDLLEKCQGIVQVGSMQYSHATP